jgi:hypothetical protein
MQGSAHRLPTPIDGKPGPRTAMSGRFNRWFFCAIVTYLLLAIDRKHK